MKALQVIKESKMPASLSRFSPPHSPTKRSSSQSSVRGGSKLLASFDALMAAEHGGVVTAVNTTATAPATHSKILTTSKPLHPFFLTAGTSRSKSAADSDTARETVPLRKTSKTSATVAISKPVSRPATGSSQQIQSQSAEQTTDIPLPLYSYEDYFPLPTVVYTRHEEEADELVQSLKGPLGFDMEWRLFMRRNRPVIERRTAVVQLSDEHMVLIVQVSQMKKFPQKVKDIIESPDIVKTGANIRNDGEKLFRDFGIVPANLVELGAFAHRADPTFSSVYHRSIVSLAKMVERYTGKTLDKGKVRTGNWETAPLSQEQLTYAANDAHCALMVYNRLVQIALDSGQPLTPATYACNLSDVHAGRKAPVIGTSVRENANEASASSSAPDTATSLPTSSNWPRTRPLGYVTNLQEQQGPPRPQHLRAYNLWHHRDMPLDEICATLRSKENPLAESTVISYVVRALQADPSLPFSMERLKAFVQLEAGSWARHREWITQADTRRG